MPLSAVLADLAHLIDGLQPGGRVLVGIDGPDAAGKTTLADRLATLVQRPVVRASVDGWHQPRHIRTRLGDLSPEGYYRDSYDYDALQAHLLEPFVTGRDAVRTAAFDHRMNGPVAIDKVAVPPDALLLVDGVFLLRPELRGRWDLAVYLHVAPAVSLARVVVRDGAAVGARCSDRYLPGQQLYRREAAPLAAAHIVLDNTDPDAPTVLRWEPHR